MASSQEIKHALGKYFSLGEINALCFDLGFPYEDVERDGKTNTIIALIEYADRMDQTGRLIAYINRARPHAKLDLIAPIENDRDVQAVVLPLVAAEQPPGNWPTVIHVAGDYLQGDKVGGDKVKGDKKSTNSQGDTFNMSGNFSGAIVNVKSTLTNVTQTIGALPQADDAAKAELQDLIRQLEEALKQVPPDKAQEKEAVEQMAKMLVDTANNEQPNKSMMHISAEGLKKAAENLAGIVPDVVKIAGAIIAGILGLG